MCKARRGRASRHHSPANSERLGVGHGGACFPGKRGLGRDSNYCESIARRNSTRGIVERVSCPICATFPTYHLYWYLFLIPADGAYKQKSLEWYPCRSVLLFLDIENHMRVFDTECQLTAAPVYNSASRLIALAVTSLSAQKGKRNQQAKSELASHGQYYRDVLVCSSRRRWPGFSRGSEACG